jgi:hypothetical protein
MPTLQEFAQLFGLKELLMVMFIAVLVVLGREWGNLKKLAGRNREADDNG